MDTTCCLLLTLMVVFFRQANGYKYALYKTNKVNWTEAANSCTLLKSRFARLLSEADQQAVQSLMPPVDGFFWIGLKGQADEDRFIWPDSSVANYTNWAEGFPGNKNGLNCGRIRYSDFKWETFNCSSELYYLCENKNQRTHYAVTAETKVKGLAFGFGLFGGLIALCCLMMQLPCCRIGMLRKIEHLSFGENISQRKQAA